MAVDAASEIQEASEAINVQKQIKLISPDSKDMFEMNSFWNEDFRSRLWRYLVHTGIWVLLLICMSSSTSTDDDEMWCQEEQDSNMFGIWVGLLMVIMSTLWMCNFWWQARVGCCCSKSDGYLFSVHTRWSEGIFVHLIISFLNFNTLPEISSISHFQTPLFLCYSTNISDTITIVHDSLFMWTAFSDNITHFKSDVD